MCQGGWEEVFKLWSQETNLLLKLYDLGQFALFSQLEKSGNYQWNTYGFVNEDQVKKTYLQVSPQFSKCFLCIPYYPNLTRNSQMTYLRHTANKLANWDLNPGLRPLSPVIFPLIHKP